METNEPSTQANPALQIKEETPLGFDPFPTSILGKIDASLPFRPMEKEGQLMAPITAQYKASWNHAPVYLEEKSEVWCGAEYGATTWLKSRRLGTFPTPLKEGVSFDYQNTVDRYLSSLVTGGDNHITLLTAAHCLLYDRLWWYILFPTMTLTTSAVLDAERGPASAEPAEHYIRVDSTTTADLCRLYDRPIVVVGNNPRYVTFWRMVCGDGTGFASLVESGGKKFCSPWAALGFKGLLKALIVTTAEPDGGDMDFLEMHQALNDYVNCHGLVYQAACAARLASRLPWLVKYKYVDIMPQPVHSADLLEGARMPTIATEDMILRLPPRFCIATLLLVGHLMETRFVHWMTKNIDLDAAKISLGAGFRKLHHLWESQNYEFTRPLDADELKEIIEIGEFLGHLNFTLSGDPKFRGPGVNTSYWEAALVGPIPGTSAHAVLCAQRPQTTLVGGTVVGVSSAWFAKIRASNLFESRKLECPYNDFPFPTRQVPQSHLTEVEHRLAYAEKDLPAFELFKIHFGRTRPVSSYKQVLLNLAPCFPPGAGCRNGGTFTDAYLTSETTNSEKTEQPSEAEIEHGDAPTKTGWNVVEQSVLPKTNKNIVDIEKDAAIQVFVNALRASGIAADFESTKEMAIAVGWTEGAFASLRVLGDLCDHYQVGLLLESEALGCFRYSVASDTVIRMFYLETQKGIGWASEIEEKKAAETKKGVRFVDGI